MLLVSLKHQWYTSAALTTAASRHPFCLAQAGEPWARRYRSCGYGMLWHAVAMQLYKAVMTMAVLWGSVGNIGE